MNEPEQHIRHRLLHAVGGMQLAVSVLSNVKELSPREAVWYLDQIIRTADAVDELLVDLE